jgi:hypothetical protein
VSYPKRKTQIEAENTLLDLMEKVYAGDLGIDGNMV